MYVYKLYSIKWEKSYTNIAPLDIKGMDLRGENRPNLIKLYPSAAPLKWSKKHLKYTDIIDKYAFLP